MAAAAIVVVVSCPENGSLNPDGSGPYENGWTALYSAAWKGHQGIVASVLVAGARVDRADSDGWTPLIVAAQNGHAGVCSQLLDGGASVNAKDNSGETVLVWAKEQSKPECAQVSKCCCGRRVVLNETIGLTGRC